MFRTCLSAVLTMLLALSAAPIASAAIRNPIMRAATEQDPKPAEGKAMVVFLRPSGYGNTTAASLYLAPDDALIPLAVMYHHEKYAVQVDPGKHRFMVNASKVLFLDAELEAGKRYYVTLRSEIGPGKAKFQLIPMAASPYARDSARSQVFAEAMARAQWIERAPKLDAWYAQHRLELEQRKADALRLWQDPEWTEAPRRKMDAAHALTEAP